MNLSKEDLFHDGTQTEAATAANGETLDFNRHGDDVMGKLWWFVHTNTAGNITVVWQTSDNADMSGAVDVVTKTVANAAAGSYPVKNEPLPKGLKRYNRLKVTTAAAAKITAGLICGRDEGVPFKGL